MFLLDTDICSYIMKRRGPALVERVAAFAPQELKVSSITVYELEFGAEKSGRSERLILLIRAFLDNVAILPFDREAALHAASIRADLAARGTPIGAYDLLIAGHARSLGATLVTHNQREYSRVPRLQLEDWFS
jgi:tRNA(fMet)-specific endonuclease VapC